MNLADYSRLQIRSTKQVDGSPEITPEALAASQGRLCDLMPGEFVAARSGSVHWDSETKKFTVDTWNGYLEDNFTASEIAFLPLIMKALVEKEDGSTEVGYVADLRWIPNITSLVRSMYIDQSNLENSTYGFYQKNNGTTLLSGVIIKEIEGPVAISKPGFEAATLELAEKAELFVFNAIRGDLKNPPADPDNNPSSYSI